MTRTSLQSALFTAMAIIASAYVFTAHAGESDDRSARFESAKLVPLVKNLTPVAHWIEGGERFWVRNETANGVQFLIVDAPTGKQSEAFDHGALATALEAAGLEGASPNALPIISLTFTADHLGVNTTGGAFECATTAAQCEKVESPAPVQTEITSPDGSTVAFIRDYNLWLRDSKSGAETQLSSDGAAQFAYGYVDLFDTQRVDRRRKGLPRNVVGVHWSPDSRYITTLRVDRRGIPLRSYVLEHLPPDDTFTAMHPEPLITAADNIQPNREIAVFDVRDGTRVVAQVDVAKLHDFAPVHFVGGSLWWNLAGGEMYVVTASFGGQTYGIAAVNLSTGAVRTVVEESEQHYYAFSSQDYQAPSFYVTSDGSEAIFYSQRSGAGQLYLYDAQGGRLKNAITGNSGVVFELIRVDEKRREVYFTAGGREAGLNPYFTQLYRASFDGGKVTRLTPEDAVHEFAASSVMGGGGQSQFSPSGNYFADVFSTLTQPPKLVIRNRDGKKISEVQEADSSALEATGWKPPETFVVKAADGKTDLYGVMIKPVHFDPALKYAVVDMTYPGPQTDSGPHSFAQGIRSGTTMNAQSTAEAGLIVVVLDGRGSTRRDRAFRYAFAGTEDIFGAGDHKAGIENLARQYPYVDASRVGITGASFGGYGSMRAALLFPGFFDVVVSHVGPHEYLHSLLSADLTNQRFFGVPGTDRDFHQLGSNIAIIDRLEADLMLVYGEIDENVPLRAGITVFDALMKADKDFTSYVVANATHGGAVMNPYIVKRQRRFFAEHLGGPVAQ